VSAGTRDGGGSIPPDAPSASTLGAASGSIAPPSKRSLMPSAPPEAPSVLEQYKERGLRFVYHTGQVALLTVRTFRSLVKRPLETTSTLNQMFALGVKSMGIVTVTSIFIGMVMAIQFAYGLRRFGGLEYIPRVIVLSFARELAPTLTAVIVGGRIGSGMAAEVGAMNVTEQIDAIRALGADPAKKLVLPRVLAAMLVMPLLGTYALTLGTLGAIFVCAIEFEISPYLFYHSSLESLQLSDFFSGISKTPVFGFLIAILGCHFGLETRGGTEGVGTSTTRTVVVVSIAILIADFLMTKLFIAFGSSQ
jgi:phospholipid/cholesterol/gamma-HCH transport system permease protein